MKTRSEPFLWIHLGGIVVFPLTLAVTLIGLGTGTSYGYLVELPLIIAIAILPVLLMQLYRPFNIFSVLFLSLKPETLTEVQRKILALFQTRRQKTISAIASLILIALLLLLYYLAPKTTEISALLPQHRSLGLTIAMAAFFGSNLFLQVPLSALQVLLASETEYSESQACSVAEVKQDFTAPGLLVSKIPFLSSSALGERKTN